MTLPLCRQRRTRVEYHNGKQYLLSLETALSLRIQLCRPAVAFAANGRGAPFSDPMVDCRNDAIECASVASRVALCCAEPATCACATPPCSSLQAPWRASASSPGCQRGSTARDATATVVQSVWILPSRRRLRRHFRAMCEQALLVAAAFVAAALTGWPADARPAANVPCFFFFACRL